MHNINKIFIIQLQDTASIEALKQQLIIDEILKEYVIAK